MTFELGVKQQSDHDIARSQQHERPTPAEGVGEKSADELPSCHTHDGPRKEAGERRLTLRVRHRVSDPSHRQWNYAGRRRTDYDAEENQPTERAGRSASQATHGARERGSRDHAVLAIAVTNGSVKQL